MSCRSALCLMMPPAHVEMQALAVSASTQRSVSVRNANTCGACAPEAAALGHQLSSPLVGWQLSRSRLHTSPSVTTVVRFCAVLGDGGAVGSVWQWHINLLSYHHDFWMPARWTGSASQSQSQSLQRKHTTQPRWLSQLLARNSDFFSLRNFPSCFCDWPVVRLARSHWLGPNLLRWLVVWPTCEQEKEEMLTHGCCLHVLKGVVRFFCLFCTVS